MSNKFESWSELYKWASEGKPIKVFGVKVLPEKSGRYVMNFHSRLNSYSKPVTKKEITLYRYTIKSDVVGHIYQSHWQDREIGLATGEYILKTESKTVEVEE